MNEETMPYNDPKKKPKKQGKRGKPKGGKK